MINIVIEYVLTLTMVVEDRLLHTRNAVSGSIFSISAIFYLLLRNKQTPSAHFVDVSEHVTQFC